MNKAEMQKTMRVKRDGLNDREQKSAQICRHVLNMPEYASAKCVMLYMPVRSEVDVRPLLKRALEDGKRVCLPVCGLDGKMDAAEFESMEHMRLGAFGSREPLGDIVPPEEIDLIICPGVAFDEQGGRLGYGKGYYDRYLEKVHAFWAGICYTECIVTAMPAQTHDVPMKALVTQAGVMRIGGNQ